MRREMDIMRIINATMPNHSKNDDTVSETYPQP